eukprot:UN23671
MRSIIDSHKRNLMIICPFICRTHFMSKNVTRKLGKFATLEFEEFCQNRNMAI